MLHGIIKIPVTDLRARADFSSERYTQILFGTPVEIHLVRKKFSRIKLPDGYVGWCRTQHIHQVAFASWRKFVKQPKAKIKKPFIQVFGADGKKTEPYLLFFGTQLITSNRAGKTRFDFPGGIQGWLSASSLKPAKGKLSGTISGSDIVRTAKKFLGTPYLWGGITPYGCDCSGLVQIVFGFHNILLPRNSKDQRKAGHQVRRDNLRPGDLLFFPGHVAISMGKDRFIHASASRGMVMIESLDPTKEGYREDLDREFICARRISP